MAFIIVIPVTSLQCHFSQTQDNLIYRYHQFFLDLFSYLTKIIYREDNLHMDTVSFPAYQALI